MVAFQGASFFNTIKHVLYRSRLLANLGNHDLLPCPPVPVAAELEKPYIALGVCAIWGITALFTL